MKHFNTALAVIAWLPAAMVNAQNTNPSLVTNGGFETRSATVRTWDQLSLATGWNNANGGSADVFSPTASPKNVGVPANHLGNSAAFEGEAYGGFVAWHDDQRWNWKRALNGRDESPFKPAWNKYSEYIQTALTAPLTAGQKYDITFRVKLADGSDRAVSGIGAVCTAEQLAYNHRHRLSETPDVVHTGIIDNKKDWVEVKGTVVAEGNEKFLVIGALGGIETKAVIEGADNRRAYYYIDGVSVQLKPEDDRDKDGVPDKEDNCPDEAGLTTLGGCPDKDGDGVADKMDACPDKAGPVAQQGCPDSDGDGVADNIDKCPKEPGVAAMKGCPALKEETKRLFEKALTGIQFETGSAVIKKTSFGILDQVVSVMNENPSYNLDIHGHTDSQGDDAKNMSLSENRAAAVKQYLVNKGVKDGRLRSAGFGETKPVADNTTSAGRAKNRRVEFTVTFSE